MQAAKLAGYEEGVAVGEVCQGKLSGSLVCLEENYWLVGVRANCLAGFGFGSWRDE